MDATEQSSENQTGNEPVTFPSCSKDSSTDIQNAEQHVVTNPGGYTTTSPLTTATSLIEEGLVRDEQTNATSPINLYTSPQTEARNALRASGFWE